MRVFDQCMTGLVFFHLMMTAILGIKKMPGPAILCAILWLFDAAFWWVLRVGLRGCEAVPLTGCLRAVLQQARDSQLLLLVHGQGPAAGVSRRPQGAAGVLPLHALPHRAAPTCTHALACKPTTSNTPSSPVRRVSVHKRFYRPHECLSLISAAEMDSKEVTAAQAAAAGAAAASPGKALSVDDEVDQRYLSPSFKFE